MRCRDRCVRACVTCGAAGMALRRTGRGHAPGEKRRLLRSSSLRRRHAARLAGHEAPRGRGLRAATNCSDSIRRNQTTSIRVGEWRREPDSLGVIRSGGAGQRRPNSRNRTTPLPAAAASELLRDTTMEGGKDKHEEKDRGLFSNMMHGGRYGYPHEGYGYPPQGYPPPGVPYPSPGAYPPPPIAYPPQYGYPPSGGYHPSGYPGYGGSHGGGHMGPWLAGGAGAAAVAYGAHKLSHGGHGGYGGHMGYGGYGGHGHGHHGYGHSHGHHGYGHYHGGHGYGHHGHGYHHHYHHGKHGHGKFKKWKC